MALVQVGPHARQPGGQAPGVSHPVPRVTAGAALDGFRDHPPLQPQRVVEQVPEGEGPRLGRPLQVLGRQGVEHPHRAGSGVGSVDEEGRGVLELGESIPGARNECRPSQNKKRQNGRPSKAGSQ